MILPTNKSKIKIAQIITRMDWGGAPDVVRTLCQGLDREAFDLTLVYGRTCHPSGRTARFLNARAVHTLCLDCLRRDVNPLLDLAAFFSLYRLFRKQKFDIVHTHTSKAGALGRCAARLAGVRVIVHTPHGHVLYGYGPRIAGMLFTAGERFLRGYTDIIVALTKSEADDMCRHQTARHDQIRIIQQGVDLEAFAGRDGCAGQEARRSLGIDTDAFVVGSVGRIERVKGTEHLVTAARAVCARHEKAVFVLAGEGQLRTVLEKRVRQWNLEKRIRFIGWREDVHALLNAFDLFVFPSLNEACGIALLEARANGLAVIAAASGGIPDVARDDPGVELVRAGSSDALARAIDIFMRDNDSRRKIAALSAQRVCERYCVRSFLASTENLYRSVSA